MVLKLKRDVSEDQIQGLVKWVEGMGLEARITKGESLTIIGLIGNTRLINEDFVAGLSIVDSVTRISEPYKNAGRHFHPDETVIRLGDIEIGNGNFTTIAGPCSIESHDQISEVARKVKDAGARILRGGAFKPRTSPYDFQGLRSKGIEMLLEAKRQTGLPIITEIMDIASLPLFENVDIIQVGARNMQNFELLRELGHTDKIILVKRGLANTLKEVLMSAEYIMAGGNSKVILCERGIRTFETATRNTLDISAVPMLKKMSHLPVFVDPSHASGVRELVPPLSYAAIAAGADGIMVEVHNDPEKALCDGPQSLRPEQFSEMMGKIREFAGIMGRRM